MRVRIKKKVVEMFPKKEEGMVVMKRKNWKKIAVYTAAGLAVVGAGIVIAVKLKNGDDISNDYESLIKNTDFGVCDPVKIHVLGDGVEYTSDLLLKENNVIMMTLENMSLQDLNQMVNLLDKDMYDITNETPWDEILLINH